MKWFFVKEKSLDLVFLCLTFQSGSVEDPPGKEGLTYLTGEMLLRGTLRRTRKALQDRMDLLGANINLDVSRESVQVTADCTREHLGPVVRTVLELLTQPRFLQEELDKLVRQTVLELAEMQDGDSAAAGVLFSQALRTGHPYGRPSRGYPQSLAAITLEDVTARHKVMVNRNRLLLGLAAPISSAAARGWAQRVELALPEGDLPTETPEPLYPFSGLNVVLGTRPGRNQAQVILGQSGVPGNHPHMIPIHVAATGFGGTFTSTLVREIREKRGWSYSAGTSHTASRFAGSMRSRFAPKTEDVVPAIRLTLHLLKDLKEQGLAPGELDFARQFLIQQFPFHMDTTSKNVVQQLAAVHTRRPDRYMETYRDKVAAVTHEQVMTTMGPLLQPGAQTLVVVGHPSLESRLQELPGIQYFRVVNANSLEPLPGLSI